MLPPAAAAYPSASKVSALVNARIASGRPGTRKRNAVPRMPRVGALGPRAEHSARSHCAFCRVRLTCSPGPLNNAPVASRRNAAVHVTRLLRDKRRPVCAFVHRLDDRSDRLRALGAEIVEGDLRDFRSVAAAMSGIRQAYFAYPVQEGLLDAAATFAAAARSAGVEQVVNLSQWLQPGGEQPTPHQARHWLVEQIFDWADVGAVHLDATVFYENLRTWALSSLTRAGVVALPWGPESTAIPMVGAEDVA